MIERKIPAYAAVVWNILNHDRAEAHKGGIPYPHLARHARIRPDPDLIANYGATSYDSVRRNLTISANPRVMRDVHERVNDAAVTYLGKTPENRTGKMST